MNTLLDSVDDFKTKLQKQKYNLFGVAAIVAVIATKLVDVYRQEQKPTAEIIIGIACSLFITLLLWNNYYSSGKLAAKDLDKYKNLNNEIDGIVSKILVSPSAKELDEWCATFIELELTTAQSKVITKARLDFSDFTNKYSVMSRKDIVALSKPENAKPLTKKQVSAILKACRMKPNTEITADALLNEHGGGGERWTLGEGETTLQTKSTSKKGGKFIAVSMFTSYIGWRIIENPTADMVLDVIISCLPYIATIIFAWKAGFDDVHDKLQRRNQNRKRLLLQFIDDKKIDQPSPS